MPPWHVVDLRLDRQSYAAEHHMSVAQTKAETDCALAVREALPPLPSLRLALLLEGRVFRVMKQARQGSCSSPIRYFHDTHVEH